MKELCIDARMLCSSGIGTYLQGIMPYFVQSSYRVRVLVDPEMSLGRFPWLHQCDVIEVAAPIYSLREQWLLPMKIPPSDLFFSPHYNIPLGRIRARRRFATIHDLNHLALSHFLSKPEQLYAKWMLQQALIRSERVCTVSRFSQREIGRYFGPLESKVTVISLGVDPQRFGAHQGANDRSVIERYRLPTRYALFVGSLKPHKNLRTLLLALKDVEGLSLCVIGQKKALRHLDTELETIAQHPSLSDRVHFFEAVPAEEMPSFYRGAFVTVVPSLYEGFGLPVVEAFAAGSPVIASNAASLPEVYGDAALSFSPHSSQELVILLRRLLQEKGLRSHLQQKGLLRSAIFSWQICAEKHLEWMESVP